jgi:hypothetical protein
MLDVFFTGLVFSYDEGATRYAGYAALTEIQQQMGACYATR